MEPVIHLRGAVCLLGRFPALAGVDLHVDRGETVLVEGPNGAGKSTLLRLCAGLHRVAAGEARVLGVDLAEDRMSVRAGIGLLAHATSLYDDLTVTDNVRFWTQAARADRGDAERAMRRLGLSGRLADVKVSRLSSGQRRRVAIAVLVARRPRLWLLDEPHAGLDQEGRDVVDQLVVEAVDAGATVVLASHELDRAEQLAARHVTLVGGAVVDDTAVPGPAVPAPPSATSGLVQRAP